MKSKVNVRSRKRTTRSAVRRQQSVRKEERKQAKYSTRVTYVSTVVPRCKNCVL